jgi:hypothetical protein
MLSRHADSSTPSLASSESERVSSESESVKFETLELPFPDFCSTALLGLFISTLSLFSLLLSGEANVLE